VRPHELDIVTDPAITMGIRARVNRIRSFGVSARVELDGVTSTGLQHFEVELEQGRANELALVTGQIVRLLPSRLRLFERSN